MLMDMLFNNKIWTILITLILLFTIVNGLRYMGLYEGLENSVPAGPAGPSGPAGPTEPAQSVSKQQQIATVYNF
jgi:hypothetical protein